MNFIRIETKVPENKKIVLDKLPFQVGESVEIIVLGCSDWKPSFPPHTLRGKKITFLNPTEPVAEDDWETLR